MKKQPTENNLRACSISDHECYINSKNIETRLHNIVIDGCLPQYSYWFRWKKLKSKLKEEGKQKADTKTNDSWKFNYVAGKQNSHDKHKTDIKQSGSEVHKDKDKSSLKKQQTVFQVKNAQNLRTQPKQFQSLKLVKELDHQKKTKLIYGNKGY